MVPVVADADSLFGGTTRGMHIHLDYQGLIRLHWSPLIIDDMARPWCKPDSIRWRICLVICADGRLTARSICTLRIQSRLTATVLDSIAPASRRLDTNP